MQNYDDDYYDYDQQQQSLTSEYGTGTLVFNDAPASFTDGPNYHDIVKLLSQVELPPPSISPSPMLPPSCSFQYGQSSGTKNVHDVFEAVGAVEAVEAIEAMEGRVEGEQEVRHVHENLQASGMLPQAHVSQRSAARQRRRGLIHDRIRILKELVPHCNKRDQASILEDAITYIRSLQMQLQMMQFTGAGTMAQGLYMSPGTHPGLQGSCLAPYFMMRPIDGMGYNMGNYGSYFNSVPTVFPPFGSSSFHPLIPPMRLPIPRLQRPSQTTRNVKSTTLSSDNAIASSQVATRISSQSPYHMPPVTRREGRR